MIISNSISSNSILIAWRVVNNVFMKIRLILSHRHTQLSRLSRVVLQLKILLTSSFDKNCVRVLTKEVTHFRIKFSNSLLGIRKMNLWIKMANNFQQDTLITVLFLSSLVRMTTFSIIAVQINVNWLHMNSNIPNLSLTHFAPIFLFILIFSSVKEHLYSLKTSENLWFYDLFSGYRCCKIVRRIKMGTKAQYGLMKVKLI